MMIIIQGIDAAADFKMLFADSPPKELSMTVIIVVFKTVHEKSSLKGVSPADWLWIECFLILLKFGLSTLVADYFHKLWERND